MGQSQPLFVYFHYFLITISIIQIEKSVDGVLGIQTQGLRMVGADETTECHFLMKAQYRHWKKIQWATWVSELKLT